MKSGGGEAAASAAYAMIPLLEHGGTSAADIAHDSGCVRVLTALVMSGSPVVQAAAASLVCAAGLHRRLAKDILETAVVRRLVNLLSSDVPQVCVSCLRALNTLSSHGPEQAYTVSKSGSVSGITALLGDADEAVAAAAAHALEVASSSSKVREDGDMPSAVHALVPLLHCLSKKTRLAAMKALQAATQSPSLAAAVREVYKYRLCGCAWVLICVNRMVVWTCLYRAWQILTKTLEQQLAGP